ncbi:MAG: RDD family protein [Actinomycetota bacterium]
MTTTAESIPCHACGSPRAAGSTFCGACGSPVSPGGLTSGASVPPAAAIAVAAGVDPGASGWGAIAEGPLAGRVPARPGRRVGAFLIDGAAASVVVLIASVVFYGNLNSAVQGGSSSAITSAFSAAMFGPLIVWVLGGLLMLVVEGATGATIGNAAVRIRTVSASTGGPPGFGRAFLRRLVEELGSVVVFGGVLIAASSTWDPARLRQGWQDKAAGTTMVDAGPHVVAGRTMTAARPLVAAASASGGRLEADRFPSASPLPAQGGQPPAELARPVARPAAIPVAPPRLDVLPVPGLVVASGPVVASAQRAGGLIANVPGFESEVRPAVAPRVPVGPTVKAPVAAADPDEDLDYTRMSPAATPRAGSYQLVFDTGEIFIVEGGGLVGRNPAPRAGERVEHLIPIADPARSVSKTHLVFGAGPDGFWVSDRDSTNGTRTLSADGVVTEAAVDARVGVPVGGTVEFGERRFTVAKL